MDKHKITTTSSSFNVQINALGVILVVALIIVLVKVLT